jgi:hypothetical protein
MTVVTTPELCEMFKISREQVRRNVARGVWPTLNHLGTKPFHFDLEVIMSLVRQGSLTIESRKLSRLTPRRGINGKLKKSK